MYAAPPPARTGARPDDGTARTQEYNSLMYIGIAGQFVVCFLAIHFLAGRVDDRTLFACGLLFEVAGMASFLAVLPASAAPPLWQFILCVAIFVAGLPFFMVALPSLFSKLTSERHQGLLQGLLNVRRCPRPARGPRRRRPTPRRAIGTVQHRLHSRPRLGRRGVRLVLLANRRHVRPAAAAAGPLPLRVPPHARPARTDRGGAAARGHSHQLTPAALPSDARSSW